MCDGQTLSLYTACLTDGDTRVKLVASVDVSGSSDSRFGPSADGTNKHWSVQRGYYGGGHVDRWYGLVDEARISDEALDLDELLFRRVSPLQGPETACVETFADTTDTLTIQVENVDDTNPISIDTASLATDAEFSIVSAPTTLQPKGTAGSTGTVELAFNPGGVDGKYTDVLTLTNTDGSSSLTVAVTGAAYPTGDGLFGGGQYLKHRWSFNTSYEDVVGCSDAEGIDQYIGEGGDISLTATAVRMNAGGGNKWQSSFVKLGNNVLPDESVTIELWATQHSLRNFSWMIHFGLSQSERYNQIWSRDNVNQDRYEWFDDTVQDHGGFDDQLAPFPVNTEIHYVLVFEGNATPSGLSRVSVYAAEAGATDLGAPKIEYITANTLSDLEDYYAWLGRSHYGDPAPDASYNEVRIWNGALGTVALEATHDAGPNSIPSNISAVTEADVSIPYHQTGTLTITVGNGANPVGLNAPTLATDAEFSIVSAPTALGPFESGEIVLAFDPAMTPGIYTDTLTITSTGTQTLNVALTGYARLALNDNLLCHRWDFNGALQDPMGGSDAQIIDLGGNDATLNGNDITLAGGAQNVSDYVQLGSHLLRNIDGPVTIELWATKQSIQNWARIFAFYQNGDGGESIRMTWNRGTEFGESAFVWDDNNDLGFDYINADDSPGPFFAGTEYHIAVVIEPGAAVEGVTPGNNIGGMTEVTLYGIEASAPNMSGAQFIRATLNTPGKLNDEIGALGRSEYGDSTANASYNEVRIWRGALTKHELDILHKAGPDVIPAGLGAATEATVCANYLSTASLSVEVTNLNFGTTLTLNNPTLGGTDFSVLSFPATLAPGESGVVELAFDPSGAKGIFNDSLEITTDDTGSSATVDLVGESRFGLSTGEFLDHRWSFNGGLTDSEPDPSDATIVDIGPNDVTVGANQVTLSGGTQADSDYVDLGDNLLPDDIDDSVTIELWATQHSIQNWSRLFAWGTTTDNRLAAILSRGTAQDQHQFGFNPGWNQDINDPNIFAIDEEYHVVVVIEAFAGADQRAQTTWYVTPAGDASIGAPIIERVVDYRALSLAALVDFDNRLGVSYYPDNTANASYNEVRIWKGALGPDEVNALHALGPDSLDVPEKPVITLDPVALAANPGSTPTLTADATGTSVTYQWYKDSNPIGGATSTSLTLGSVSEADQGDYFLRATNIRGSVDSATVLVRINDTPAVVAGGTFGVDWNATENLTVASVVDDEPNLGDLTLDIITTSLLAISNIQIDGSGQLSADFDSSAYPSGASVTITGIVAQVTDTGGLIGSDTFTIIVGGGNTNPTVDANDVSTPGLAQGALHRDVIIGTASDNEDAAGLLTASIVSNPTNLVFSDLAVDGTGVITATILIPTSAPQGLSAAITLRVTDTGALTDTDSFRVFVEPEVIPDPTSASDWMLYQ